MFAVLVLAFIVVPIIEIYVIIQVAQVIGGWETLALLIIESIIGGWLMKREGLAVLRRIQAQLERSQLPSRELVDGFLILFAGALMLTPGFVTDLLGYLLLIPPTRSIVRKVLMRRFRHRLGVGFAWVGDGGGGSRGGRVYDTTGRERERERGRSELEP